MGRDFYKILGVPRSADDATLKKAYRKLAVKWHPDKNRENPEEAKKKFQEIGEAFHVLSDPDKRRIYDQFGEAGLNGTADAAGGGGGGGGGGPSGPGAAHVRFTGVDPAEIFRQFFGTSDPFAAEGGFFGGMGGAGRGGGGPAFMFSTSGGGAGGGMPRGMFGRMGGMGGMDEEDAGGVPGFSGRQRRSSEGDEDARPQGPPVRRDLVVTLEELFEGTTKRLRVRRKRLQRAPQGVQLVDDAKVLEVTVRPGWKAGTKLTFHGEGDESPRQAPSDIIFTLKEAPHDSFRREGDDLHTDVRVSLRQALTEERHEFHVPTIDKQVLPVVVTGGITPQRNHVLRGHGMPSSKDPSKRGDLVVHFDIQFPALTPAAKHDLRRVLPAAAY